MSRTNAISESAKRAICEALPGIDVRFTEHVEPRVYVGLVYQSQVETVQRALATWCRSVDVLARSNGRGVRLGYYRVRAKIKRAFITT